jgi:hypothetical protein
MPPLGFSAADTFFDVDVASSDLVAASGVQLGFQNLTPLAPLSWYNGSAWVPVQDASRNAIVANASGSATVTLTLATSPSLANLHGTNLLGGPARLSPGWKMLLRTAIPVACLTAILLLVRNAEASRAGLFSTFPCTILAVLVVTNVEAGPGAAVELLRTYLLGNCSRLAFLAAFALLTPAWAGGRLCRRLSDGGLRLRPAGPESPVGESARPAPSRPRSTAWPGGDVITRGQQKAALWEVAGSPSHGCTFLDSSGFLHFLTKKRGMISQKRRIVLGRLFPR